MQYIINDEIKFNTTDYTLEHIPTSDFIKLALPAGRLLETIIKSNGEVLSREKILTEVWDNYGLRGSNNNLSQYLSTLRKNMTDFGCGDFIITIPKTGITLNKSISVSCEVDNTQHVFSTSHPSINRKKRLFFVLEYAIYTLLLFFLYLYYFDPKEEYYSGDDFIAYERVLDNNCRIVFSKDYSQSELIPLFSEIKKILSENKLHCSDSTIIYFDHYISVDTQHLGRTLLSYCNIGPKKDITSCENVYFFDRGSESE